MYGILDIENGNRIVSIFEDEDSAKERIYSLRKARYQAEHPHRPVWEYDTMRHDNGYNVIKFTTIA